MKMKGLESISHLPGGYVTVISGQGTQGPADGPSVDRLPKRKGFLCLQRSHLKDWRFRVRTWLQGKAPAWKEPKLARLLPLGVGGERG